VADDLTRAVEHHTELHNQCVRTGDWAPFLATFSPDATMTFASAPVGPLVGRDAIAAALAARPPKEEMLLDSVETTAPDTTEVIFHFESGRPGEMTVRWRAGMVASVERR
jgi:hypothetical protein